MQDAPARGENPARFPDDGSFADWLAGLIDRVEGGEAIDFEAVASEHPERAGELAWILPMIAGLVESLQSRETEPARPPGSGRSTDFRDFEVGRTIGQGGMAVVYEAIQRSLNRRVALKVLPQVELVDRRRLLRFYLEAYVLASLDHPHVVPIYGVGCEGGRNFLAMRLIKGPSAAQVVRERRAMRGPKVAPSEVVASETGLRPHLDLNAHDYCRWVARIGMDAANALDHAHGRKIIHRDVKPSNLLIDDDGTVWVADFGLARVQGSADLTLTGENPGTIRYMSPEQWLGDAVDHRIDVYGLGASLYELLTLDPVNGVTTSAAGNPSLSLRTIDRKIPRDLESIVLTAISYRREDRYSTAGEMAEDLERFLNDRPIQDRRRLVDHARKWTWRNRQWVSAVIAASVFAVALFAYIIKSTHEHVRASTEDAGRNAWEARRNQERADRHLIAAKMAQAREALKEGRTYIAQDVLDSVLPENADRERQEFAWSYLSRLSRRTLVQLRGHRATVLSIALSPDGRTLATGDRSGALYLWDPSTGRRIGILESHRFPITLLRFSADSALLISGAGGLNELYLWDVPTRRKLAKIDIPEGNALTDVAILGHEGRLIYKMDPGDPLLTVVSILDVSRDPSHPKLVRSFEKDVAWISSDSRTLLLGTIKTESIAVADTASGEFRWGIPGGLLREPGRPPLGPFHQNLSYAWIGFSGDGRFLATVEQGKHVGIRSTDTGIPIDNLLLGPPVLAIALSRDGNIVALAEESGTLRIWDRVARSVREFSFTDLRDFKRTAFHMVMSPDGTRLALASKGARDGTEFIAIWETATGRKIATWPSRPGLNPPMQILFGADNRSLWVIGDGPIVGWNPEADRGDGLTILKAHIDETRAIDIAPDGRSFVTGSDDDDDAQTIKVWDAETHRVLRRWIAHSATVSSVAISPDGKRLASGSLSRTESPRIWDYATGRLLAEPVGLKGKVRTIAFSPDGLRLAAAGNGEETSCIVIWDTASWAVVARLEGHNDRHVHNLRYSRDGHLLASAGEDRTVRVWDTATNQAVRIFTGGTPFYAVGFSPDMTMLAAVDQVGMVARWNLDDGKEYPPISCDDQRLNSLAFSPDGRTLAVAAFSGVIHLLDPETGVALLDLNAGVQVNSVRFTPDGRSLAATLQNGEVRIWRTNQEPIQLPRPLP